MGKTEFIIVGDTEEGYEVLVAVIGKNKPRGDAEEAIDRMTTAPDDFDKELIGDCTNLRIKEVVSDEQWWNDPFLAN